MREISVNLGSVNLERLTEELKTAHPDKFVGASTRSDHVIVFVEDAITALEIQAIQALVENHDPMQLTAEQQVRIIRKQAIDSARLNNTVALNLSDYDAADALIQQLARKIRWLELELRDLQGLD